MVNSAGAAHNPDPNPQPHAHPNPNFCPCLKVYEQHAWAAGAWRDVFADLVQGQLQQLFLTLLRRLVDASGVHVEACGLPFCSV